MNYPINTGLLLKILFILMGIVLIGMAILMYQGIMAVQESREAFQHIIETAYRCKQ
ncbi:hypothetical protein M0R04_14660 [Candidatus Dojkabacteria bacterium]|jgi:uncharacterized membrane protein (Fun14 family)|nr:hypothetical protein [Candidatus Dojkabacteria bacterium]